jgi:hypothetical protein
MLDSFLAVFDAFDQRTLSAATCDQSRVFKTKQFGPVFSPQVSPHLGVVHFVVKPPDFWNLRLDGIGGAPLAVLEQGGDTDEHAASILDK